MAKFAFDLLDGGTIEVETSTIAGVEVTYNDQGAVAAYIIVLKDGTRIPVAATQRNRQALAYWLARASQQPTPPATGNRL
jgi:hypothetical protein